MKRCAVLAAVAVAGALACGGGGGAGDPAIDPGADEAADVVADGADVPGDAPVEVPADPAPEAASDVAADLPSDAALDVAPDLPADLPADVPGDVPPDAPADLPPVDAGPDLPPVEPRPFVPGLSTHVSPWDPVSRAQEMDLDRAAGMEVLRTDFIWSQIEPAPGDFRFDGYDQMVADAESRGMRMLVLLVYSNALYESVPGSTSSLDPAAYARFAAACAARYGTRVAGYEVWNEPNLDRFWTPRADPAAYGALLKAAAAAIRRECPACTVVSGGLAQAGGMGPWRPWTFLEEAWLAHPDLGDAFDVLALHPYTVFQWLSPEEDNETGSLPVMIDRARLLLAAHGTTKPLWVTEGGWPSAPPPPAGPETPPFPNVDNVDQARYLVRGQVLAASRGVEMFLWYTTFDGPLSGGDSSENWFGLMGHDPDASDDVPPALKPSYAAARTMNTLVGGRAWEAEGLSSTPGVRAHRFGARAGEAPPGSVLVAWAEAGEVEAVLPATAGGQPFRAPDRVLSWTGEPAPFATDDAGIRLPVGPDPVFLVWDGGETTGLSR